MGACVCASPRRALSMWVKFGGGARSSPEGLARRGLGLGWVGVALAAARQFLARSLATAGAHGMWCLCKQASKQQQASRQAKHTQASTVYGPHQKTPARSRGRRRSGWFRFIGTFTERTGSVGDGLQAQQRPAGGLGRVFLGGLAKAPALLGCMGAGHTLCVRAVAAPHTALQARKNSARVIVFFDWLQTSKALHTSKLSKPQSYTPEGASPTPARLGRCSSPMRGDATGRPRCKARPPPAPAVRRAWTGATLCTGLAVTAGGWRRPPAAGAPYRGRSPAAPWPQRPERCRRRPRRGARPRGRSAPPRP